MQPVLYYFGFDPSLLDENQKKFFAYLTRSLFPPNGDVQLVPIDVTWGDPKISKLKHVVIFRASELKKDPKIQSLHDKGATSFCVLYPGDNFILTLLG